jgi:hypothetical protein
MCRILDKCKHNNGLNLRQINMINKYLHIWGPSLATHELWMCGSGRRLDHFIPKLINSIENLVEDSTNYLNGPPKRPVNYPEPLVVTNNMEKHCNMLLNRTPTSFSNKASTSKKVA